MTRIWAFAAVRSAAFLATALACGAARADTIVVPAGTTTTTTTTTTTGQAGGPPIQVIIVEDPAASRPKKKRTRIQAVEGEEPPAGYHEHTTNIRGLWVAGVSIFASAYAITTLAGAVADVNENHDSGHYTWLGLIPGAGPFIIAADQEISGPADPMFVLLGIMEVAGIAMTIGGLAATDTVWLADEASLAPRLTLGLGSATLAVPF